MAPAKIPAKKTSVSKKHVAKKVVHTFIKRADTSVTSRARTAAAKPRKEAFAKGVAAGKPKRIAAKEAGYSERSAASQASRLCKDAEVTGMIVAERNRIAHELGITATTVLREINSLAVVNMQDYAELCSSESSHEMREALKALTREQAAAIQEVTWETFFDKSLGETVGRVKLKLTGHKLAASEQLGRHINLHNFGTAKVELTGKDGGPIEHVQQLDNYTDAQLEQMLANMTAGEK